MMPFCPIRRLFPGKASLPLAILLGSLFSQSCGGEPPGRGEDPPAPPTLQVSGESLVLAEVGFATPESVIHDAVADVYLVSNINGAPAEKDGNGFISRVSPQGEVLALRWIDGAAPGVELNAPKGMAIVADTLFVTDIDCLRGFHRVTGVPLRALCLERAGFLNDLAAGPQGDLYFTDSGSEEVPGAVYLLRNSADVPQLLRLADGTELRGPELGGPNGVVADERGLFVATYGSGEVFRVTPEGRRVQLLPPSDLQLDGLVSLGDRGFLFSSWGKSAVYATGPAGQVSVLLDDLDAPADIGFDGERGRVLIPLFRENELRIVGVTF